MPPAATAAAALDATLLSRSSLNAYIKRVSAKRLDIDSGSASSTRVLSHDHVQAQIGATVNMRLLNSNGAEGSCNVEPRRGQSFGMNQITQELTKRGLEENDFAEACRQVKSLNRPWCSFEYCP